MKEVSNTKEADELLEAIKFVLLTYNNIMGDGRIDFRDVPTLIYALSNLDILFEGVEGVSEMPREISEISALEAMELGRKYWEVFKDYRTARLEKP